VTIAFAMIQVRQRFRIVNRQTRTDRQSYGFLGIRPSRLRCFPGATAGLFVGHCFEAALAADPSALGPNLAHNPRDDGKLYSFGHGDGFQGYPAGVLNSIEVFSIAIPLWHIFRLPRYAAARRGARISNRPTTR